MKPPAFEYAAPTTIETALQLLAEHAEEDPRVLAGGQSLVPMMNFRLASPGMLIDLRRVSGLAEISVVGDVLRIGAMVRMRDAELSAEVAEIAPMMTQALAMVAHVSIRHSATIGGSVVHADPAAELPAVLLALDAELVVQGLAAERVISAADFFDGPFTTTLGADEILTGIMITRRSGGQAFVEFARTHGSFALVGVGVDLDVAEGEVSRVAIALSGVADRPVRASAAEQMLLGSAPTSEAIETAARAAAESLNPSPDVHGSTETRREIAHSYIRRGILAALDAEKEHTPR